MTDEQPPADAPVIRVTAMPADVNPYGDMFAKYRLNRSLRLASPKKGFCACTARTVTSATTRENTRRSNAAMIHTLSALSPATISRSSSSTPDSAHKGAGKAVFATLLISN